MEILANFTGYLIYILISLAICKVLYWKWENRHLDRFFENFTGGRRFTIFSGLKILKYKNNVIHFISNLYDDLTCSTIFGWLGPVPILLTTDVELIQKICTLPNLQYKSTVYSHIIHLVWGLPFISGKQWRHHRRMLNPSFHNSLLLKFMENFNNAKDESISEMSQIADGSEHRLDYRLICLTMRTMLDANFATVLPKEEVHELTQGLTYVTKELMWHMVLGAMNLSILTRFDKKTEQTIASVKQTLRNIFDEKLRSSQTDNKGESLSDEAIRKNPNILINQSIELYKRHGFPLDDLLSELFISLAASFDTTGLTMYFVLVMLAMHPEVQERVFEEVAGVFPHKSFKIEYHHITELPYLDMVIKETMRLFPPVLHIARDVPTDTAIAKDVILPRGLQIVIPIFHLHRCPDIWGNDANEFNPENFLPENGSHRHPYAYIPFAKGPRNCIGWRFAEMMLSVVLAGFIRNFRFETDAKYEELEFESGIAIDCKNHPLLRIFARAS